MGSNGGRLSLFLCLPPGNSIPRFTHLDALLAAFVVDDELVIRVDGLVRLESALSVLLKGS
jgi:hypothetical protein